MALALFLPDPIDLVGIGCCCLGAFNGYMLVRLYNELGDRSKAASEFAAIMAERNKHLAEQVQTLQRLSYLFESFADLFMTDPDNGHDDDPGSPVPINQHWRWKAWQAIKSKRR